jgi:hypothetical protein
VDQGEPGAYNVVDSDPAAVNDWLPYLASVAEAKSAMRVPLWLRRLMAGPFFAMTMTSV